MTSQTPAERIRAAAERLEEAAKGATPGPWDNRPHFQRRNCTSVFAGKAHDGRYVAMYTSDDDAAYIALAHPGVGLAVAAWLRAAYADWEREENSLSAASVRAMSGATNEPDQAALAVADQVLGGGE